MPSLPPRLPPAAAPRRRLWLAYGLLGLMCWWLYAVAATDWQRGSRTLWDGLYESTWNLGPILALGPLVMPWTRRALQRANPQRALCHAAGALLFVLAWHALDFGAAALLFGLSHAQASLEQGLIWRSAGGAVVYGVLVFGFGGVLHAQQAHAAALRAAQAEAARTRAELAALSGKLNPHFLFNTLNSLLMLTRRDSQRAETALLGFARLMRYVLDTKRGSEGRVSLAEELDFVRDYLALETLRLGERLRVSWQIDDAALEESLPPLTLQPLVENAIAHGIATQVEGGALRIEARCEGDWLHLSVHDDGPGCTSPPAPGARQGLGLSTLQRRFEIDYEGRARMTVRSAPGAGFTVDIQIPRA
jgi:signal transduction histidine kinase